MKSSLKKLSRIRELFQNNETKNRFFSKIITKKKSNHYDEFISRIEERSNSFLTDTLISESKSDKVEIITLRIGNGYCNANCDYCFVDFSRYDTKKSIQEYIQENKSILKKRLNLILNNFDFAKNIEVDFFTDGEPLLFQELIIDAIKLFLEKFDKERISFEILTNGSIPLSKDFISLFSLTKNFMFQVSYDGCPSLQNIHRKIKTEKILKFVETLRKYSIKYRIHSVVTSKWLGKEHQVAIFCNKNFYDAESIAMLPVYVPIHSLNKKNVDNVPENVLNDIFINLYFYFGLFGLLEKIPNFEVSSFCLMNTKLFYSLEDEEIYYCDVFKNNYSGEFTEGANEKKFEPLVKRVLRGKFEGDSILKYNNKGFFLKKAETIIELKKNNLCYLEPNKKCPFSRPCIAYLSCPGNFFKDSEANHQNCLHRKMEYLEFVRHLYLEKRAFPILFRDKNGKLSIKGYKYTLPLKEEVLSVNFSLFSTDKNIFFFKINSSSETAKERLDDLIKKNPESVFISLSYSEELLDYFNSRNVIMPKSPKEAINYLQLRELNNKNEFEVLSNDVPIKTISYNPDESVIFLE